jgi:hypothetical protein
MTYSYSGKCTCGQTVIRFELPEHIETLTPRACDCDYSVHRNANYLSHPDGKLTVESMASLRKEHQGSGQATFHSCPQCSDLVMVTFMFGSTPKGALNASVLDCFDTLQQAVVSSPKLLSAGEKVSRWDGVWMLVESIEQAS